MVHWDEKTCQGQNASRESLCPITSSFIMPARYKDFLSQKLDLNSVLPWCLNSSPPPTESDTVVSGRFNQTNVFVSTQDVSSAFWSGSNLIIYLLSYIKFICWNSFLNKYLFLYVVHWNKRGRMVSLYHLKYNTFLYINSRNMKIFGHNSIVE